MDKPFSFLIDLILAPSELRNSSSRLGAKGIEIGQAFWEIVFNEVNDSVNTVGLTLIAYEFGRNFFVFSSKILFPASHEQNGGFAEGFANLNALNAVSTVLNDKSGFLSENLYYKKELYRIALSYLNNQSATPETVLAKNGLLPDKNRNIRALQFPAGFPASGILFLLDSLFSEYGFYPNFFDELATRPNVITLQDALDNIFVSTFKATGLDLAYFFDNSLKFHLQKQLRKR